MNIRVAVDIDDQILELSNKVFEVGRKVNLKRPEENLPYFISLKMPTVVEPAKYQQVVEAIYTYVSKLVAFDVDVEGIEKKEDIIWLKLDPNPGLVKIHNELCQMLNKRFHIGNNGYDLKFIFHVTLFMDSDFIKINRAYEYLKHTKFPKKLHIKEFFIASSDTGYAETYNIVETATAREKADRRRFKRTVFSKIRNY